MSEQVTGSVKLYSRINYPEQVTLKNGEGLSLSPYSQVGPIPASLVPDSLPRGIIKQSVGDN